jgi:hypothetical protein
MSSVLERRRELLDLMRNMTLQKGHFTVSDIAEKTLLPRSTIQDWLTRLIDERCVLQKEEKRGRHPAKFVVTSTMLSSACRRIFTTIDGDAVAIYHECMSGGCAAYCAYYHEQAQGAITSVNRDGTWLIERARLGVFDADIGLYPASPVGVVAVRREGDMVIQTIRCIGGPAYSLTDMMAMAEGVVDVHLKRIGNLVEGEVVTRALCHLVIGIDDTDSNSGGATFALALGLLQFIGKLEGVIPISHHVVMLNPALEERTTGNSCSFIQCAIENERLLQILDIIARYVSEESLSDSWGVAVKQGFIIPDELRKYGRLARKEKISPDYAKSVAAACNIRTFGGRGIIGALAAISYAGQPHEVLLDPAAI